MFGDLDLLTIRFIVILFLLSSLLSLLSASSTSLRKKFLNPPLILTTERRCLSVRVTVSTPFSTASVSARATAICSALRISWPFHRSARTSADSNAYSLALCGTYHLPVLSLSSRSKLCIQMRLRPLVAQPAVVQRDVDAASEGAIKRLDAVCGQEQDAAVVLEGAQEDGRRGYCGRSRTCGASRGRRPPRRATPQHRSACPG
ncbi:hypothetical protein B0T17DRAFT_210458 [Bombardia bombarda]|uniref:Uncharacterized protein n=1 Tax=Bombardia bombarda TaxID=252184 RepID=A0AA40C974_9PEZI|nr:hypothetical protein B0T17DRAFT_210458 [Bombardia bombarda]